jgi:DNA-directed RNA polymerase specialized sigma24 family protein
VLVNLYTDWWRGRLRWERPVALPPDRPAPGGDVAGDVLNRRDVVAALRCLTRRERAVLVCRFFLDLTERQTAEELEIAVGTVKSTAARALAKLRISPELNPGGEPVDPAPIGPITEGAS